MSPRIFVPGDSGAVSVGADEVAMAIAAQCSQRGLAPAPIRNGSRGLYWLEPLFEVERDGVRVAYGPVGVDDVPGLLDAIAEGADHPLCLGPTAEMPYLAAQTRVTFERVGVIDPLSMDDYRAHGGLRGLEAALAKTSVEIVDTVEASGLRGRGGAGFPTGIKWRTVAGTQGPQKYIVCNADEGDSGTFSDRMLMEGDPYTLLEGMAIAGLAVGADHGFIYLRSEYPHAWRTLTAAIERAEQAGLLGDDLLGSGKRFRVELIKGAGSYVCGEETSLLESIEGKRGLVRAKPPLPAVEGLFGLPTVVNNVITLASVPAVLADGAEAYASKGVGRSRGTLAFQLAGNCARPGLVEVPFGLTLRELLYDFGGGTASGRPIRAVQAGGPLGAYLPEAQFDLVLDYESFAAGGGTIGHGGLVVFDDAVDMAAMARYAMAFCAEESCGKCTPCRIGSVRGVELLDRMIANRDGDGSANNDTLLRDLCRTMVDGSLCAMGGMTPFPVLSALNHYPEDFGLAAREPEEIR
jgi:formate dehydrogenase iron-sulfur subunit